MSLLRLSLLASLLLLPFAHADWREEIPQPVHPDKDLVDLYHKTWEIAHGRVRVGPKGLPASPYMDENCYENDIWIWDTCFMSLFSKYAPKSFPGMESLDNFYIPIHEDTSTPLNIHLRDNPPLFAWVEGEYYTFSGDKKRLDDIFKRKQYLQKHFEWFNTVPKGSKQACSHQGIFRGVVEGEGFTWTGGACGMDNTPRGRDCGGYDAILWIDAISQQALSARYIAELYERCGMKKEAAHWKGEFDRLARTINELYWDEEDGFYYDVVIESGKPCKVKTLASFWPLLAGVASKSQAARLVEHLKNPGEFGGEFPLPTLSRDDKDYNDETGDYWRGGIWLPTSYMVVKGLERYGYHDLADEISERTVRQQLRTFHAVEPHTIWECYAPGSDEPSTEVGRRARPDFCGWSALGPISMFIEHILGFHQVDAVNREIHWTLRSRNGAHGLKNLRFGDTTTDILFDGERTVSVTSNKPYTLIVNGKKHPVKAGRTVFQAAPRMEAAAS